MLIKGIFVAGLICAVLPPLTWANVFVAFTTGWCFGYIKYAENPNARD